MAVHAEDMTTTNLHDAVDTASGAPASGGPPAIELVALTKSYRDVHAVRGVDLTLAPGEIVWLKTAGVSLDDAP